MKRFFYILPLAFVGLFPEVLSAQSDNQRAEILPLIKTEWGQQAPFYYKTPVINGEHAKTGCVATAMSQVIYYHKHPAQGKQDVFSFDNFSFDFANHTFDYAAMKEKYDRSDPESDISVQEVSDLMYACGVTANMDYGIESSSGNFSLIPKALNEWFLYPKDGMGMLVRDYFTTSEWEDIIYDELAAGRPVLYMGGNGASSHVFVCDGYRDGKFHMNLGWYGEKNDYLPLSNLQTERVGKEGLWSMNASQKIIRGIRLDEAETPAPLTTATTFGYDADTGLFSLTGISCFVDNTFIIPGIRIINSSNSKESIIWADREVVINRSNSTITYDVELSGLDDGTYMIRPVYKLASQEEAHPVYCNILNTRYYTVEIVSNRISNPKAGSDIEVNVSISEYTPASTYIKGENYGYGFTVFAENTGNTTITKFGIRFCKPGTDEEVISRTYYETLAPGDSKTVALGIPNTATPGNYDMVIYDAGSLKVLSDPINITYHDSKEITTIEGSPFRYMPLSEDSDEAMILLPKTSSYELDNGGEVEIESSVNINGKDYSIAELGPRLLYGRNDITSLSIPSTIKKIDAGAFGNCPNISEITVYANTPPALHSSAFDAATVASATLKVPEGSVDMYKEAPIWNGFSYASEEEEDMPESLSMPDFSVAPGEYSDASLYLDTEKLYYGCQFNITVPEGLTIASDGVTVAGELKEKGFTVGYRASAEDDNSYKVVMYSADNTALPTGKTAILDVKFLTDIGFKVGSISLTDIKFSQEGEDSKFYDVKFDDTTSVVTADLETLVESVASDNQSVDIYNIAGVKVLSNINPYEALTLLPKGVYIVKSEDKSYKILIK